MGECGPAFAAPPLELSRHREGEPSIQGCTALSQSWHLIPHLSSQAPILTQALSGSNALLKQAWPSQTPAVPGPPLATLTASGGSGPAAWPSGMAPGFTANSTNVSAAGRSLKPGRKWTQRREQSSQPAGGCPFPLGAWLRGLQGTGDGV